MSSNGVSNKTSVALSIEVVLIQTGTEKYHQVTKLLEEKFNADFLICFDNPHYLRDALKQVYGNNFESVVEQIIIEINDLANNDDVKTFLERLQKVG